MGEVGIDFSGNTSDHVDACRAEDYDLVVTTRDAARESCPVFPGPRKLIHCGFEDPDHPRMDDTELAVVFRRIRDEIGGFCSALLAGEGLDR